MKNITSTNQLDVETAEGLVLVDFYKDYCQPCATLGTSFEAAQQELEELGAKIVKVNAGRLQPIAIDYGVMGVPHVFLLKDGEKIADFGGAKTAQEIIEFVKAHA